MCIVFRLWHFANVLVEYNIVLMRIEAVGINERQRTIIF